jgi:hypothetical protein
MSTSHTTTGTPVRRPQWWRAAADIASANRLAVLGFVGLLLVVAVAGGPVVRVFTDLDQSIVRGVLVASPGFMLALGLIVVLVQTGAHVAAGMTRRSFLRAATATSVLGVVIVGLGGTLALVVEGAVYRSLDIPHGGFGTGPAGVATGLWDEGIAVTVGVCTLASLAGVLAGLAVGAGFQRFGGLKGSVYLPLGALTLIAAMSQFDAHSADSLADRTGLGPSALAGLVGALTVVCAVVVVATLRSSPFRTPQA